MTDLPTAALPPAGRRPRSFWIALVLGCLLLCSLAVTASLLALRNSTLGGERPFEEETIAGETDAAPRILDIPLVGTINDVDAGGRRSMVATIIAQLRQARTDARIQGVLIEMNTPGGGITASDVLYHEVDRFRAERKIPVVVLCDDVTASGGYYVAMAADHIMAHETSVVGSIGVIAQIMNVQGLLKTVGVQVNVIKSQRADGSESFKDIGSPFREMKPAERAMMQDMIQKMWSRFVDVVATGRKGKLTRPQVEDLADGRVWTGRQARDLALVDSLGYQDDALRKVMELAHVEHARLVRYRRPFSLFGGGLFGARWGEPDVSALVEQALDPAVSTSPHLMYLWTIR